MIRPFTNRTLTRGVYYGLVAALLAGVVVMISCDDRAGGRAENDGAGKDGAAGNANARGDADARNNAADVRIDLVAYGLSDALPALGEYVGSQACAACHAEEHEDWTGSYHDKAMDHATAATVLGDFNDRTFTHDGITSRFFEKDDKFFVNTLGEGGEHRDYEIKFVFGVHPLQQYLIEFPRGRLQALSIAWDTGGKRWFHLYPHEHIPHDDPLFWTKPLQNWNFMCASCHSTKLEKKYDVTTDSYKTTWDQMDVGCEACHGPGAAHVEWAETRGGGWPGGMYYGPDTDYQLVNPMKGNPRQQIETCAPCHARRSNVHPGWEAGRDFHDHFSVELLRDGLYHADGQILDEVYVYGSFLQSKMYHNNVKCSDCHNPHSTKIVAQGSALCIRCHQPEKYDTPAHHHHPIGTVGTNCIECHMPQKTYMVVDPRRDHSFQLPRPDLTVKLGVPNACNCCHEEETAEWAAEWVEEWYGPKRHNDPHFAPLLTEARAGEPAALPGLIVLLGNKERPAIVRATAASFLTNPNDPAVVEAISAALRDDEWMVRRAAIESAVNWPEAMIRRLLAPLLDDEVRAVRTQAARALSRLGKQAFADPADPAAKQFRAALDEFRAGQIAEGDRSGPQVNLGNVAEALGELKRAEAHYRKAIDLEPYMSPAYSALAVMLVGQNRYDEAEEVLLAATKDAPQVADPWYDLGRLYGELAAIAQQRRDAADEQKRLRQAADAFGRAAKMSPDVARFHYNHGVAFLRLGQHRDAEPPLRRALSLEPGNAEYRQTLAGFYNTLVKHHIERNDLKGALPYAERLAALYPDDRQLQQMVQALRARAGG